MTSGDLDARPLWRVIGSSVQGASHKRNGSPNQDAIAWVPATGASPFQVLAIADGHGSPENFRSGIGADLAVQASTTVLADFLRYSVEGAADAETLSSTAGKHIPRALVRQWADSVGRHSEQNPFPVAPRCPLLPYGSTVLAVLATAEFLVYLQLGDGDILIVSEGGEVRRPWPRDERWLGGETASLCSPEAWTEIRVGVESVSGVSPELVLLSTDGYANSFRDDDGFLRVGRDFLDLIRTEGIDAVGAHLTTWLEEASELGSGDDITVGALYRQAAGAFAGRRTT